MTNKDTNTGSEAAGLPAPHTEKEPKQPEWALIVQSPAGGGIAQHVSRQEREAVACWLSEIEACLAGPVGPRERKVFGDLAAFTLLQWRIARQAFKATQDTKKGTVKPQVSEARSIARFIHELLGSLKFRDARPPAEPDFREKWNE